MKVPHFCVCFWLFVGFVGQAQTTTLTSLSSGLYLENSAITTLQSTISSDRHTMLYEAIKMADLEELLNRKGPFTFFAPSNTAFSRFNDEEWDALFKEENKQQLKQLLTYHMVAGNLTASKILQALCRGEGQTSFTTIQGTKLHAFIRGIDIVLRDAKGNEAIITSADASHSNGVVHQIDSIILPPGMD